MQMGKCGLIPSNLCQLCRSVIVVAVVHFAYCWLCAGGRKIKTRNSLCCDQSNYSPRLVSYYSMSKKIPPEVFWIFFPKWLAIFINQILPACCTFQSTLDYKFLFCYLQLWRSYAMRDHPVQIICAKYPPSAETHAGIFWHFFPNSWEFLI